MTPVDLSPMANHLWQSTLCVGAAWLLTLAMRKNRAAVRYWVWLVASVKFLIPFSLLAGIGSHLEWRSAAAIAGQPLPAVVGQIGRPFALAIPVSPLAAVGRAHGAMPAVLFYVWLSGVVLGLVFWVRLLLRMRAVRRTATPLDLNLPIHLPIRVLSSPARLEPGVFGIRKPVLILPEGIAERLTPGQLEAVLAHELCHVRRRDNLTAAMHMAVEVVFWFHPLVWWLRTQLVAERERACDEAVVTVAGDPRIYAEAILNVCKFYLESPVVCVSGITGADLKKRIAEIMARRMVRNLGYGKKLLLAAAALGAVAGPIATGLMKPATVEAQAESLPRLEFEVASIKPWVPTGRGMNVGVNISGPLVRVSAFGVTGIIEYAYDLKPYQISGAPRWTDSERYDIAAKAEGDTRPSDERVRRMLQTLLADRFQLRYHRETRELPVYALVAGKKGPNVKESAPDTEQSGSVSGRNGFWQMTVAHGSMDQLAQQLSTNVDRPVIDKTGLTGFYDYKLENVAPENAGSLPDSSGVSIFTALQEQLGLKLEPQKGAITMLVIDRVEKPSEN